MEKCPQCGAPLWALITRPGRGCDECGFIFLMERGDDE